jgi:hypothetical protein
LKIKLKDRHFDAIEVLEADSQTVLNSLTEHDFEKRATSRVRVASNPKVFDQAHHQSRKLWMAACIYLITV